MPSACKHEKSKSNTANTITEDSEAISLFIAKVTKPMQRHNRPTLAGPRPLEGYRLLHRVYS
eukprot:825965-Amphidinium_carterae.1